MLAVLRQRNFVLVWLGGIISLIGNWLLSVALPIHVYNLTHSTLVASLLFMAEIAPAVLFSSIAGVFVDRWDRKRTLIFTDFIQIFAVLPLLLVQSPTWVWIAFIVPFIQTSLGSFFTPAKNALMPLIVSEKDLTIANSLGGLGDQLTLLIGPALGGVLVGLLGLSNIVLLDSGTFVISVLMLSLLKVPPRPTRVATSIASAKLKKVLGNFWHEWQAGLRIVQQNEFLATLFIVGGISTIGAGLNRVLMVVFVEKTLHGGSLELGGILAAQGAGGIIGSLLIGLVSKFLAPMRLLGICMIIAGILLTVQVTLAWAVGANSFNVGAITVPTLVLILLFGALAGIPMIGFLVSAYTLLQSQTNNKYRGRVIGAYITTVTFLQIIGMFCSSPLESVLGVVAALNLASAILILAGLIALLKLPIARPANKFAQAPSETE